MVLQYRQCAIYLFEFTLGQHTSCDVNTIRPIYSVAIVIQMFQNGTYTLKLLWSEGGLIDINVYNFTFAGKSYRSGTVNSKSFVGKVLLRIKRKFELN